MIFWDESGISQKPTVRRTWSPKGKTPVITSTGSWRSRSVIGIIISTPCGRKPKLFLRIFKHSIKYPDVIRTIKEFHRHIKRKKVFLIWDGLSSHWAKDTIDFIDSQKWLKVFRFPCYAPELNPLEYLWSVGKGKDLAHLYVNPIDELDIHIRRYKRRIQRRPDLLTSFLKKSSLFNKELSS